MDKNGLLVNFLLGLVNWLLAGIHAQTANSLFPEGCADFPASWAADGDANNAAKDWYCGKEAHTTYALDLASVTVTDSVKGWDDADQKFKIAFGAKPLAATNPCPVDETGTCNEVNLFLSSTASTENGSPLKIEGNAFYGWLEWQCTVTSTSRPITYGFPIEKDDASSFISEEAAGELNTAFLDPDATPTADGTEGQLNGVTEIQSDLANWNTATFAKVDDNAGAYFMMKNTGDLYKVFSNVTLKLTAARYAQIISATTDGDGAAVTGPEPDGVALCAKVFKLSTAEVCTACTQEKCGAMQIAPKMILSLLTILLLQCFK